MSPLCHWEKWNGDNHGLEIPKRHKWSSMKVCLPLELPINVEEVEVIFGFAVAFNELGVLSIQMLCV